MQRSIIAGLGLIAFGTCVALAQSPAAPAFEAADIRVRPHFNASAPFMTGGVLRGGRYDLRNATMLDLIVKAYGVDPDVVLGGPSWLETTRFDIVAKAPDGTPANTLNAMIKALLADRFKLVARQDRKPTPAFALTVAGPKHKMMEGGSGGGTCQPVPQTPQPGSVPILVAQCRNMAMDDFAKLLRNIGGPYIEAPVVNNTVLPGGWDFEFRFMPRAVLAVAGADAISLFDALEKQLGLKLTSQTTESPVLVIDSVNEQATPITPEAAKKIPAAPPAEFDVATLKRTPPEVKTPRLRIQPGGRIDGEGATLKMIMSLAWDINDDQLVAGTPSWFDTTRYTLQAMTSSAVAGTGNAMQVDRDDLQTMLRALLADRLKLKMHMEPREVSAYTLVVDKPKLEKANPADRTRWKEGPAPNARDTRNSTPILARLVTVQNMTMAQFAERLQGIAPGYIHVPVEDGTGLPGSWSFSFTFTPVGLTQLAPGAGASGQGAAVASDPNGALTLPEALSRQLGLKLDMRKRKMPVLVIDHVEEEPVN